MPLLLLTDPRPDLRAGETPPVDVPHTEVTLGHEWVGDFTELDGVGLTLTAGWAGARIRLVHAQVYDGSSTPTSHVNLLGTDEPYEMKPLERKHFGPLPAKCGAVTVQYECPTGSLHAVFEYSPKAS